MGRYDFLVESYATERLKTLSAWTHVTPADMDVRGEPRARTPREQMVHQCQSEDGWMRTMLGIDTGLPPLPDEETPVAFVRHYARASSARLAALLVHPDDWFEESTAFFGEPRSRAWVLVRRIAHSSHHRGQLVFHLRLLGRPLHSTYGPTADTGGLPSNGGKVIYRFHDAEDLVERAGLGHGGAPLPGVGSRPVTERPDGREGGQG